MATKETRAVKRQKVLDARNVRRRAKSQRRAHRLVSRYLRRVEIVNERISEAITRQKALREEWQEAHRTAIQAIKEAAGGEDASNDSGESPAADSELAAVVEPDGGTGEGGGVLPDSSGTGRDCVCGEGECHCDGTESSEAAEVAS